jgi:hypothetical protein
MKRRHITIPMVGVVLACVFTASAIGQEDRSSQEKRSPQEQKRTPQENQSPRNGDIDVRPYLAQGYAQSPIQAVLLQRMQAACPANTKRAVMFDLRAPLAWFGCWRERNGKVEIAFEDGDFLALEHDSITWLPETGA